MKDFNYYAPTEVVFGKESEEQVAQLVKKYGGTKVLVHYGGKSAERSGLLDKICGLLSAGGVEFIKLGGVVPNPRLSLAQKGIDICRKEGIDFILAVGGGSVIDSSKCIAYGVPFEGNVWDIYLGKAEPKSMLPVAAVLTIPAAGSEMSEASVITNEKTGSKRSYNSNLARPKFAVCNPELTMTLPAYQTASGCADILMHTEERYFTQVPNMELTDEIAEGLMRTVIRNAKILMKEPENYDARAEVMWASSLSHNGLTGCGNDGGDFACHGLEHELGGMFDVAHGAGLAAVWGSWARYVYQNCLPRFKKFAVNVCGVKEEGTDEEIAVKGIEAMEDFYRSIGMPTSLHELGIAPTEAQLREMAKRCAKAAGGKKGSAKVLYEADMLEIYKMANSR